MQQKKARKNYPIFRVFRARVSSGGRTSKICNQIHHEAFILMLQLKPATTVCKDKELEACHNSLCHHYFGFLVYSLLISYKTQSPFPAFFKFPQNWVSSSSQAFRCFFFPLLVQTTSWFSSLESKTLHRIQAISLEFCLHGCFCFVSSVQNKNLEEKNKANNTDTL